MATPITIRNAPGTWVVRTGGAVLAETTQALELTEGDLDPVIYFPRADVGMTFLDPSDTRTQCPQKGEATAYSIAAEAGTMRDSAWSYEDPLPELERIKGYIAFYTDKVNVEQL